MASIAAVAVVVIVHNCICFGTPGIKLDDFGFPHVSFFLRGKSPTSPI